MVEGVTSVQAPKAKSNLDCHRPVWDLSGQSDATDGDPAEIQLSTDGFIGDGQETIGYTGGTQLSDPKARNLRRRRWPPAEVKPDVQTLGKVGHGVLPRGCVRVPERPAIDR